MKTRLANCHEIAFCNDCDSRHNPQPGEHRIVITGIDRRSISKRSILDDLAKAGSKILPAIQGQYPIHAHFGWKILTLKTMKSSEAAIERAACL
jgi:hypothetical protein